MFGLLKKSLKESIKKITRRAEEGKLPGRKETEEKPVEAGERKRVRKPPAEKPVKPKPEKPRIEEIEKPPAPEPSERPEEPEPEETEKRRGIFGLKERITTRKLSGKDIDEFFSENETEFLSNNVAVEVMDFFRKSLKEKLAEKPIKRTQASQFISQAFGDALLEIVSQGEVDLEGMIRKKKPLCMVFLGFNGSGKTTSIAKVAKYLMGKGFKPVLAAGDTFRAASIEQLEEHGRRLGVRVIKHQYGSDSAAVIFDAVRFAEANGYDAVLADTAGRVHTDRNLMDELRKVARVNKPDLKVLVVDSLTGNDAVEQATQFHEAVGVDAVMMTKTDVDPKGGSILSVCYAIKKPILFIGTGQGYGDIVKFDPGKFVRDMLS